jgi:Ca2+-binding EF-hand superfamily protein
LFAFDAYINISESFQKFDVDKSGFIDAWELKEALKSLGQNVKDEELFSILSQVDSVIHYSSFVKAYV